MKTKEEIKAWVLKNKDKLIIAGSVAVGTVAGVLTTLWVIDNVATNSDSDLLEAGESVAEIAENVVIDV